MPFKVHAWTKRDWLLRGGVFVGVWLLCSLLLALLEWLYPSYEVVNIPLGSCPRNVPTFDPYLCNNPLLADASGKPYSLDLESFLPLPIGQPSLSLHLGTDSYTGTLSYGTYGTRVIADASDSNSDSASNSGSTWTSCGVKNVSFVNATSIPLSLQCAQSYPRYRVEFLNLTLDPNTNGIPLEIQLIIQVHNGTKFIIIATYLMVTIIVSLVFLFRYVAHLSTGVKHTSSLRITQPILLLAFFQALIYSPDGFTLLFMQDGSTQHVIISMTKYISISLVVVAYSLHLHRLLEEVHYRTAKRRLVLIVVQCVAVTVSSFLLTVSQLIRRYLGLDTFTSVLNIIGIVGYLVVCSILLTYLGLLWANRATMERPYLLLMSFITPWFILLLVLDTVFVIFPDVLIICYNTTLLGFFLASLLVLEAFIPSRRLKQSSSTTPFKDDTEKGLDGMSTRSDAGLNDRMEGIPFFN